MQRLRLAAQLGAGLTGALYVLDEPTIGLHQKDNAKLISTLVRLRDLGNTLIVVEHDEETIRVADWVVDMGPGGGDSGGQVVAEGTPETLAANPHISATAHSINSYDALIARQTQTTRKASQRPGRSGEQRSRISRAMIAGTKPCAKCPSLS